MLAVVTLQFCKTTLGMVETRMTMDNKQRRRFRSQHQHRRLTHHEIPLFGTSSSNGTPGRSADVSFLLARNRAA